MSLHKVIRTSHVAPINGVTLAKVATVRDICVPTTLAECRQFLTTEVPTFMTFNQGGNVRKGFNHTTVTERWDNYNIRTQYRIVPVK